LSPAVHIRCSTWPPTNLGLSSIRLARWDRVPCAQLPRIRFKDHPCGYLSALFLIPWRYRRRA